jgi:uroporphyrinogen decarboxylase
MPEMNSRERVLAALAHQQPDRTPLWLGHPMPEVVDRLMAHYGVADHESMLRAIGDDFRWKGVFQWRSPDGRFPLDMTGLSPVNFETLADVEAYTWPDPQYADVSETRRHCLAAKDYAIYGGSWSHFFHQVWDLMGPEDYMTKMLTNPEIVEAITNRVVDFHYAVNEKLFKEAGDLIDLFFFGNDLGTQRGLLFSRDLFLKFIKPGMVRLIEQAKSYGLHVWLHSCGSVRDIIPDLIEMGIEALHPVQVSAAGMSVEELGREFRGKITFIGGVDVHHLMREGTPEEVRAAVRFNKQHLGPGYVVSPSHEAVLPDIPTANLIAMIDEAKAC